MLSHWPPPAKASRARLSRCISWEKGKTSVDDVLSLRSGNGDVAVVKATICADARFDAAPSIPRCFVIGIARDYEPDGEHRPTGTYVAVKYDSILDNQIFTIPTMASE